jgi:hypothetical protein
MTEKLSNLHWMWRPSESSSTLDSVVSLSDNGLMNPMYLKEGLKTSESFGGSNLMISSEMTMCHFQLKLTPKPSWYSIHKFIVSRAHCGQDLVNEETKKNDNPESLKMLKGQIMQLLSKYNTKPDKWPDLVNFPDERGNTPVSFSVSC